MAKWIKNATAGDKTWVGQLISAGQYYEIQSHEESQWANDSTLLSDIGSGDAVVAKDDSGTADISDVAEAINHLKGLEVSISNIPTTSNIGIADAGSYRARLKGIIFETITAGTTKKCDWKIEQLQWPAGTDRKSYFNGIEYYAKNGSIFDKAKFMVVDKDGSGVTHGLYPQAYYDAYKDGNGELVVEEFGDDWPMIPDNLEDIFLYKASLYKDLYVRITYNSTGTVDVNLVAGLFRHLDGES